MTKKTTTEATKPSPKVGVRNPAGNLGKSAKPKTKITTKTTDGEWAKATAAGEKKYPNDEVEALKEAKKVYSGMRRE